MECFKDVVLFLLDKEPRFCKIQLHLPAAGLCSISPEELIDEKKNPMNVLIVQLVCIYFE